MPDIPSFREEYISQIPAIRLLKAMGWTYVPPEEALALRGNSPANCILDRILAPWLAEHNAVHSKGRTLPFSQGNLRQALDLLRNEPASFNGLIPTSQRVYELLTLGTTLTQSVDGDTKSHSLQYIDWQHPERNVYTVTEEFEVERRHSRKPRRPDIVCFVNGIPLVIIEAKRPDLQPSQNRQDAKAFQQAVSQMLRNQKPDEIPYVFTYAQVLMATSVDDAAYATTGTPKDYWSIWRESARDAEGYNEDELARLINQPLSELEKQRLYGWRKYGGYVRKYFDEQDAANRAAGGRLASTQDRTLYAMLRPWRLLHLAYQFIVFDEGKKKIARYQQYFAVQRTMRRVAAKSANGKWANQGDGAGPQDPASSIQHPASARRAGGVIWHTTGSGKSLTMVMLAKALALHPAVRTPRVFIVTDRINLDDQIWTTFQHCGKKVLQATSGRHLAKMIRRREDAAITTIIDKFDTVARNGVRDDDADVFLLVDESHRGQYGVANARMQQVFPNACLIGFTGTPLLKAEKSTAAKFGGFIHTYSMRQAVDDQAVLPLIYEGRMAELGVDQAAIDTWFGRVTKDLNDDQKLDLKRKFSRAEALSHTDQRIQQIAYDIGEHFAQHVRTPGDGSRYKAMLATSSKAMALAYRRALDDWGQVTSEVVISAPDTREGHETVDGPAPEEEAFWKRMMARFGNEEAYNREMRASFSRLDGVELLIVVDKLLVGFDEPRNTVLYLDKPLREHALLQAIARVNRLFEGKDFGYVIDYRGVLGELNAAMETYEALAGYDPEDLDGAFSDVSEEIAKLPQRHSAVWAIFDPVENKRDLEALEQFLAPEDVRQRFYDALSLYAKTLKVALGAAVFYETTPQDQIATYQRDLRFFHSLRTAVAFRYAETVKYTDYDKRIEKLLDQHVHSAEITQIVRDVNIFDVQAFQQELDKLGTDAARADAIAHHAKRTLTEYMERDPAFYAKFSKMIQDAIDAYRQGRISDAEYLAQTQGAYQQVVQGYDDATPEQLHAYPDAAAYYGLLIDPVAGYDAAAQGKVVPAATRVLAELAIELERAIDGLKVRDWTTNPDVKQTMKRAIDELVYARTVDAGIDLDDAALDLVIDGLLDVAKARDLAR